jgi:hypothetical protein
MKKEPVHKKVFVPDIPQEYYDFKDYVDTNATPSLKKTKPAKAKPSNATKPGKHKSPSTKHGKKLLKKRFVGAIESPPHPPLGEINQGNVDRPKRARKKKKLSI